MDLSGAQAGGGPGRRTGSPSRGGPGPGPGPQTPPRPRLKVTPFHNSPIVSRDGALRRKRAAAGASPGGPVLGAAALPGGPARERPGPGSAGSAGPPTTTAGAEEQSPSAGPPQQTSGTAPPAGRKAPALAPAGKTRSGPLANAKPYHSRKGPEWRAAAAAKAPAGGRRKKRKMGTYNLVPKKKAKVKHQEKKEEPEAAVELPAVTEEESETPPKAGVGCQTVKEEEPVTPPNAAQAGEKRAMRGESPAASGAGSHAEYTELALDCLDLKAQQELLSPPLAGLAADAESAGGDLAEELPLCCCRMETPNGGWSSSTPDQTCMAMESSDGTLSRCQRAVMKQEMMRPSNTVHLLVLCEDHRAGMVKHQCCPGCGLFCRTGTFLECRPYGSISHRFHRNCASILKDRRFCPHCGEDASGAVEVTASRADPSPSVPRSNLGPSLPAVATLPSVPTSPAVPQILRAKKSSVPRRNRDESPSRSKDEAAHPADRLPKETLENILMALDDENLKPKKAKYPTRQLYVSAKQGDLQRVIQLLVDGKDPNFVMEGQNKHTPLHAAAAEGHQEICHMLVQAGANVDMFDEEHRTPLMAACENNHLNTVKYLLRAGAAVGHKDIVGFTCLHLAAKLGHYDVVQHLLSKASKYINYQDDGGWTPITWSIEHKYKELVQLFLAKGSDVNIRDKEENVCLHWAALVGCDDIAQSLLEARCSLDSVNVHGDTPLHVAARESHLDCVMLFLSRGADVTQKNKEGLTPLDSCPGGSKVWAALDTNKKLTDARRGRASQGERLLCRDISRGYEAVPITCVNGVDSEPCPENFKYIPDSCTTSPLHMDKDITHLQHCSCTDDCSSSTCMCGQLSLRCWYDSDGRLPPDFCQWEPPVLFECNHACSCWRSCRNRVVQNGLSVRLQVFRTPKMGWGVRAMQDLPQGTFICEYVGEIIADSEADKRENDSFLFTLDNKVGDVHCIDARLFGNVGRFINHLCEPNLLAVRVFTTHQDLRFPRIAFFCSRPVRAGEQLGMDYGDNYWRVKSKYLSCQCGSPKCRHSAAGR